MGDFGRLQGLSQSFFSVIRPFRVHKRQCEELEDRTWWAPLQPNNLVYNNWSCGAYCQVPTDRCLVAACRGAPVPTSEVPTCRSLLRASWPNLGLCKALQPITQTHAHTHTLCYSNLVYDKIAPRCDSDNNAFRILLQHSTIQP